MLALQERFERWESHNQHRLRLVADIGQKQTRQVIQTLSFLLFVTYLGGRLMIKTFRILWLQPKDVDLRFQEAEHKRLELEAHPHRWIR